MHPVYRVTCTDRAGNDYVRTTHGLASEQLYEAAREVFHPKRPTARCTVCGSGRFLVNVFGRGWHCSSGHLTDGSFSAASRRALLSDCPSGRGPARRHTP